MWVSALDDAAAIVALQSGDVGVSMSIWRLLCVASNKGCFKEMRRREGE
jgi:hypothetical protein